MKVYVNDKPVDILPGIAVRHALLNSGLLAELGLKKACDEWGNEIGLDGALNEVMTICVR